jgi:hypothetical protein
LDVCCSIDNIPAISRFKENDNALERDWCKLFWMNPPCGGMLEKFCAKLVIEIEKGAEGWGLLPLRGSGFYTNKFHRFAKGKSGIFKQASLIYVIPEWRMSFGLPEGGIRGKAKTSWCLCYFGKNGRDVEYAFRMADPFKGTKYEGVELCPGR